ncbi:uncharacterized protein UTRI_04776 [Ustilago trichophora]|uniref:Uncharacterized protein n=1 Tax=Ustilago trichophora TaxID=86804 RepID=A0A5C3EGQ9_9BASI|nr:uncharacterized protein UTRI_04776 [Ustilago trichophora]
MMRQRYSFHRRNPQQARKKASTSNSILIKHYTLFNSLTRYACDDPVSPPHKGLSLAESASIARTRKLMRLKQRYPIEGISSYTWPLPYAQFSAQAQKPFEAIDEMVDSMVKEIFDAEYARFRSPEWVRKHRIRKDHLNQIVVDPKEVGESAAAAKALVNTLLSRFLVGIKKGAIGKQVSPSVAGAQPASAAEPLSNSDAAEHQAGTPSSNNNNNNNIDDNNIDDSTDLEEGLEEEIWQDDKYVLEWQSLLNYFQSTAGNSKTAQWRNWHLLNAIAKTRERCEELFGHESR